MSWVWRVNFMDSSFFLKKFIYFFSFIIQHWVDWKLCFYDLFWFALYKVILVSWLELCVWHVDSSFFFLFLIGIFLNFILQYRVDYELGFIIYLVFFYEVILVLWLRLRVMWVNPYKLRLFYCVLLLDWFFFNFNLQQRV